VNDLTQQSSHISHPKINRYFVRFASNNSLCGLVNDLTQQSSHISHPKINRYFVRFASNNSLCGLVNDLTQQSSQQAATEGQPASSLGAT
jgi:hypothetical protein